MGSSIEERRFDDHFGVCPECHRSDGFLNVKQVHFFVCHEHRVYWLVGSNLFSSWRKEDEEIWRENEKLLRSYRGVEAFHSMSDNEVVTIPRDVVIKAITKARLLYIAAVVEDGGDPGPDDECWSEFERLAEYVGTTAELIEEQR